MSGDVNRQLFEQLERSGAGWDFFGADARKPDPNQQTEHAKMLAAEHEMAARVARLFDTPDGREVLLWLLSKTILRAPDVVDATTVTAEGYAIRRASREGQNAVVHMIVDALRVAHRERKEGTDVS